MSRKSILTVTQEQEICQLYKDGNSIRKIANSFPVGRTRIGTILKKYKIKTKGTGNSYCLRKYELDENYFESIDSKEKAYWLGFILADGYVGEDGLAIVLNIKDKNHLNKFLKDIKSNSYVKEVLSKYKCKGEYKTTKSCRIDVYSKKMVSDLNKLGVYSGKSLTVSIPNIKRKFYWSLIRGIFDGDGSINLSNNNMQVTICGSFSSIEWIRDFFIKELNILECPSHKQGKIYVLYIPSYSVKQKMLDKMYHNANIFLKRKYELYKKSKKINFDRITNTKYDKEYRNIILQIRKRYKNGDTIKYLSEKYAMNYSTVSAIVHNIIWSNIK